MTGEPGRLADVVDETARDVRRVAGRLRSLPTGRLEAHRAQVRDVLQHLADTASALEDPVGAAAGRPRRSVPELPDHALGDQVDVIGTDLVVAAHALLRDTPHDLDRHEAALRDTARSLRDLRRAL